MRIGELGLGLGIVSAFAMSGCGADIGEYEVATDQDPLFGSVTETSNRPFVLATALVMTTTGTCSGTLVSPTRVITAAHCLCEGSAVSVSFAQLPGAQFPVVSATWPPNAKVCGDDWSTTSDEDPVAYSPWDVAVLTIGPDAAGMPPAVTPVVPYLADPDIGLDTQRIRQGIWAVGYGTNAPAEWTPDNCLGCGTRRSGPINNVSMVSDACDVPFEVDCFRARLWRAAGIEGGEITEFARGDSGGGLFLNVDSGATEYLVGVCSHFYDGDPANKQRWAPLGHSGDFLWDAIGLPPTLTLAEQLANTAIYGKGPVRVNDRARVVIPGNANNGRRVVAGGYVRIGVDALAGDVRARDSVEVADRGRAGSVQSSRRIYIRNGATTGATLEGEFMKFEDFSLSVPFPSSSTPLQVVESGVTRTLAAGPQGSWAVRAGGVLRLTDPGVYVFTQLSLDANSTVQALATPVWIYVMSSHLQFHGRLISSGSRAMVGAPNAQGGTILNEFHATLVAPNALIHADMVAGAKIAGSVFAREFELHQGRFLEHVPFASAANVPYPWIPTCPPGAFTPCS